MSIKSKERRSRNEKGKDLYRWSVFRKSTDHGGWAAIIMYEEKSLEISGGTPDTTNNIMELTAVIESLKSLTEPYEVELFSDSAYVVNAFNQNWLKNWKRNGWRTRDRKPVKNKEIWLELDKLIHIHNVKFIKVKGHSDNEFNNKCDELAVAAYQKYLC